MWAGKTDYLFHPGDVSDLNVDDGADLVVVGVMMMMLMVMTALKSNDMMRSVRLKLLFEDLVRLVVEKRRGVG